MKADVVVIGSGIAGLTAAALLAKKGRQVVIVENQQLRFLNYLTFGTAKN